MKCIGYRGETESVHALVIFSVEAVMYEHYGEEGLEVQ